MLLTEIDHVAIAVKDLEAAIDYYRRAFGAEVEHREIVESDGVEEALLKVAESYVQLLTPTNENSPVAKSIEKRGEGIHHIAFEVADIYAEMERMKKEGFQLLNETPKNGADNKLVCFLHPKSTNGVLIELCMEKISIEEKG